MALVKVASRGAARRSSFRPAVQRARTRIVTVARRAAPAVKAAALAEKHTIAALGTAAVFGYAKKNGMLDNLPKIDALGVSGTYGAALFLAGRYMKNRTMQHMATGLLCIAVADWSGGEGVAGDDGDGAVGGEIDDVQEAA